MPALILVLAIFCCVLAMVISVNSLMFIILPIMEKAHCPWLNHILFWSSLAVSVWIGRKVFYWTVRFLSVEDKKTQEVLK